MRGIHWSLVNSLHKGPVMWSFEVFLDVSQYKLLNKQSSSWWFETIWSSCDNAAFCQSDSWEQVQWNSNLNYINSIQNMHLIMSSILAAILSGPLCVKATPMIELQIPYAAMMTSSNGNIFRVTGHLCGKFTGPRWISRTKASDAELWCFLRSTPE